MYSPRISSKSLNNSFLIGEIEENNIKRHTENFMYKYLSSFVSENEKLTLGRIKILDRYRVKGIFFIEKIQKSSRPIDGAQFQSLSSSLEGKRAPGINWIVKFENYSQKNYNQSVDLRLDIEKSEKEPILFSTKKDPFSNKLFNDPDKHLKCDDIQRLSNGKTLKKTGYYKYGPIEAITGNGNVGHPECSYRTGILKQIAKVVAQLANRPVAKNSNAEYEKEFKILLKAAIKLKKKGEDNKFDPFNEPEQIKIILEKKVGEFFWSLRPFKKESNKQAFIDAIGAFCIEIENQSVHQIVTSLIANELEAAKEMSTKLKKIADDIEKMLKDPEKRKEYEELKKNIRTSLGNRFNQQMPNGNVNNFMGIIDWKLDHEFRLALIQGELNCFVIELEESFKQVKKLSSKRNETLDDINRLQSLSDETKEYFDKKLSDNTTEARWVDFGLSVVTGGLAALGASTGVSPFIAVAAAFAGGGAVEAIAGVSIKNHMSSLNDSYNEEKETVMGINAKGQAFAVRHLQNTTQQISRHNNTIQSKFFSIVDNPIIHPDERDKALKNRGYYLKDQKIQNEAAIELSVEKLKELSTAVSKKELELETLHNKQERLEKEMKKEMEHPHGRFPHISLSSMVENKKKNKDSIRALEKEILALTQELEVAKDEEEGLKQEEENLILKQEGQRRLERRHKISIPLSLAIYPTLKAEYDALNSGFEEEQAAQQEIINSTHAFDTLHNYTRLPIFKTLNTIEGLGHQLTLITGNNMYGMSAGLFSDLYKIYDLCSYFNDCAYPLLNALGEQPGGSELVSSMIFSTAGLGLYIAPALMLGTYTLSTLFKGYALYSGNQQPSQEQQLFQAFHREICEQTKQIGKYFEQLGHGLDHQHKEMIEQFRQQRIDLIEQTNKLSSLINKNSKKILHKIDDQNYKTNTQKVIEHIRSSKTTLLSVKEVDDKRRFYELKRKDCVAEDFNNMDISTAKQKGLEQINPLVKESELWKKPSHFTGYLLAKTIGIKKAPNAKMWLSITKLFTMDYRGFLISYRGFRGHPEKFLALKEIFQEQGDLFAELGAVLKSLEDKVGVFIEKAREELDKFKYRIDRGNSVWQKNLKVNSENNWKNIGDLRQQKFVSSSKFRINNLIHDRFRAYSWRRNSKESRKWSSYISSSVYDLIVTEPVTDYTLCSSWFLSYTPRLYEFELSWKANYDNALRKCRSLELKIEITDPNPGYFFASSLPRKVTSEIRGLFTKEDIKMISSINCSEVGLHLKAIANARLQADKKNLTVLHPSLNKVEIVERAYEKHYRPYSDRPRPFYPCPIRAYQKRQAEIVFLKQRFESTEFTELYKKLLNKLRDHYCNYLDRDLKSIPWEKKNLFEECAKKSTIIPCVGELIPLAFPTKIIDRLYAFMESLNEQIMCTAYRDLQPSYTFEKQNNNKGYWMQINFHSKEGGIVYSHTVATFDELSHLAFGEAENIDKGGMGGTFRQSLGNDNEFVLLLMYCGMVEGLGMPGEGTYEVKVNGETSLVAPVEKKFPGLWKLLEQSETDCFLQYETAKNKGDKDSWSELLKQRPAPNEGDGFSKFAENKNDTLEIIHQATKAYRCAYDRLMALSCWFLDMPRNALVDEFLFTLGLPKPKINHLFFRHLKYNIKEDQEKFLQLLQSSKLRSKKCQRVERRITQLHDLKRLSG